MEKNIFIEKILNSLKPYIWKKDFKNVKELLESNFERIEIKEIDEGNPISNDDALKLFIDAKRIEGCSERSLKYYNSTIKSVFRVIKKNYLVIDTEDVRKYLSEYQQKNNVSKITIDNVRRVISSFFTWLETEDYIMKSPTRRIH